jgi:hypothetical protein
MEFANVLRHDLLSFSILALDSRLRFSNRPRRRSRRRFLPRREPQFSRNPHARATGQFGCNELPSLAIFGRQLSGITVNKSIHQSFPCDFARSFGWGLYHSDLTLCGNYKAPEEVAAAFLPQEFPDTVDQVSSARRVQTDKKNATVCAGSKLPQIRKIQILGDQES